ERASKRSGRWRRAAVCSTAVGGAALDNPFESRLTRAGPALRLCPVHFKSAPTEGWSISGNANAVFRLVAVKRLTSGKRTSGYSGTPGLRGIECELYHLVGNAWTVSQGHYSDHCGRTCLWLPESAAY